MEGSTRDLEVLSIWQYINLILYRTFTIIIIVKILDVGSLSNYYLINNWNRKHHQLKYKFLGGTENTKKKKKTVIKQWKL